MAGSVSEASLEEWPWNVDKAAVSWSTVSHYFASVAESQGFGRLSLLCHRYKHSSRLIVFSYGNKCTVRYFILTLTLTRCIYYHLINANLEVECHEIA